MKIKVSVWLLLFAAVLLGGEYPLIQNGKAVSCIVVSGEQLTDAGAYASLELADYLEKVTGARLEIRQTPKDGLYPVYIGNAFRSKMPREVVAKLHTVKDDGFLLAVTPQGTFIWSKHPAGTIYGAYELLKRYADIRWFYPGEDGEYVPKKDSVSVADVIIVDNPAMLLRTFNHVCANINTDQVAQKWLLRNKMTVKSKFGGLRQGGGHIFSTLIPDTHFKTQPELYGLYDGKRLPQCGDPAKITARGTGGMKNQPCTSNPETVRIMKENLIRLIGKRNYNSFSILNNDSTKWCECDNCRKLDPPGERELGLVSTRYWLLFNELSDAVRKVFPDIIFEANAYQNFQTPPQGVAPDKKSPVTYCVHHRCYTHSVGDLNCKINQRTRNILSAWSKAGLRVSTYEYTNCLPAFEVQYLPLEKVVADDLKYYGSLNNYGYCDEVPPKDAVFGPRWKKRAIMENWRSNFLTHYIQAYFMWNPNADFDTVLNDIGSKFYGVAWPEIGDYRSRLRKAFSSVEAHFMYGTASAAQGMVLQDDTLKQTLLGLLEKAALKVKDNPLLAERVRLEKEYFTLTFVKSAEIYSKQQSAPCIAGKCADNAITPDGILNEKEWKNAVPVTDFMKFLGKGELAKNQTVVRAAYDNENLYLAIEGFDTAMDKLIAKATAHDAPVYEDNNFELFFAPPAFGYSYIHYVINHNGVVYDSISNSPTDRSIKYNLKAVSAVTKSKDRWTVELKIPFSELCGAPSKGASWPINVARGRQAKDALGNEGSSWSFEGRFHGPEGFRKIKFD